MSRRHPDGDRVGGAVDARSRTGPNGPTAGGHRDADARVRTLADRVARLEEELDRKERRHQDVIGRYERLLAEARDGGDPARADESWSRSRATDDRGPLAWLRSLLGR